MPTPGELLAMQVEALFTHDGAGRIVATNEPNGTPAPRFFLSRSADGNLWRVGDDVPDNLAADLDCLARAEPVRVEPPPEPDCAADVRGLLERYAPVTSIGGGPAYVFPD